MKKMTLLLAMVCLIVSTLSAETIYLNANGGCLDRMEYELTKDSKQSQYTVFSLSPQQETKLFFNISTNDGLVLDRLPSGMTSCSNTTSWDLNTARFINAGEMTVYIVRQNPQGYLLQKVTSAAYMQQRDQVVDYYSRDFDFKANLSFINYGTTLSSSLSKSEVSMQNYALFDCSAMLTMRQSPNRSYIEQSTFQIVPELGITSIAYGYDANKSNHKAQLKSINGNNFNDHLADICRNKGGAVVRNNPTANQSFNNTFNGAINTGQSNTSPTSYNNYNNRNYSGGDYIPPNAIHVGHIGLDGVERNIGEAQAVTVAPEIVPNDYSYTDKSAFIISPQKPDAPQEYATVERTIPQDYFTEKSVSTPVNPCGASAEHGYHVVLKGETLYALSKKYSVSVDQIKAWNGLKGNTINPCYTLRISEEGAPNPAVVMETKPVAPIKDIKREAAPVQPATLTEKSAAPSTDMKWLDNKEGHTVLAGETIEDLAERYGYTTERFKYINGMSRDQKLRVGQTLRTTDCNCLRAPQPYEATDAIIYADTEVVEKPAAMKQALPTEFTAKSAKIASPAKQFVIPEAYDLVSVTPVGKLVHVVEKGETLFSIAKRYNTEPDVILELNGMDKNEVIIPAQRLYVK